MGPRLSSSRRGDIVIMDSTIVDTSLPSLWVVRELDAIVAVHGRPAKIVSDNGTELTSGAVLLRSQETRIEWHYIAPGKPQRVCGIVLRPGARRMSERNAVHVSGLPARFSPYGRTTTTLSGPHRSLGNLSPADYAKPELLERNGTGRCATPSAPRPVPSLRRPTRLKSTRDSTHRWMKEGPQVRFRKLAASLNRSGSSAGKCDRICRDRCPHDG
jgi:hypothetical protein